MEFDLDGLSIRRAIRRENRLEGGIRGILEVELDISH